MIAGVAEMIRQPKDSFLMAFFRSLGIGGGVAAIIGLILLFSGWDFWTACWLHLGGLLGMLVCFAAVSVLRSLSEMARQLELLQDKADSLETTNQLLRQLLRAQGHEP